MASMWGYVVLVVDIVSMKVFVWAFGTLITWAVDRNGGMLDSHLFFYDRYSGLAEYHGLKGRSAKAARLSSIAEAHYRAAPDNDPPPRAAAMALPVRRPPVNTNAVSTTRVPKPAAKRRSDAVLSPER